jgi:hypothetical protein
VQEAEWRCESYIQYSRFCFSSPIRYAKYLIHSRQLWRPGPQNAANHVSALLHRTQAEPGDGITTVRSFGVRTAAQKGVPFSFIFHYGMYDGAEIHGYEVIRIVPGAKRAPYPRYSPWQYVRGATRFCATKPAKGRRSYATEHPALARVRLK